jgi:hypothetical protein
VAFLDEPQLECFAIGDDNLALLAPSAVGVLAQFGLVLIGEPCIGGVPS